MIDWATAGRISRICKLLDEAYDHYFECGDGYCKTSEGYVSVSVGNHWDRKKPADDQDVRVNIHSSVFGSGVSHEFDSVGEALAAVESWHAEEMANRVLDG
jgi:hypothetical protein